MDAFGTDRSRRDPPLYRERQSRRGARARRALLGEVGLLAPHPGLGRPGRVSGTREWVVHPNYILVYDVGEDAIRIFRVLHAARFRP
ncbi:type II toxin-antitoxin system RelE/ParE family toxin [Segnochrobactrum spirostomi]|uniref:type II toxin-antitoxin system RelE/ParE family toxin n=1 Tax=Segnochrobactrum spirostomi TaxID=2608987 RepID=UPI0028A6FF38|nr:type II toxin-antitoxin system RelE/ParE family toxin [Segnochrobactrum spirostomi]